MGFRLPALAALSAGLLCGQILPNTLTVTSSTPPPYQAINTVQTSGVVTVNGASTTTYSGGAQVVLLPGFTAVANTSLGTTPTFIANIAPPPFNPNSGSGGGVNFYVTASDPGGYQNITNIQLIYNWQPTGVDGCLLSYDVVNDALSMGDLTGSLGTLGSIPLLGTPTGVLGDLVNSNCQILGTGSSVTKSGNNITLFLNTHFATSFTGQQNVYMMTTSSDQQQPGSFQLVGTWTPYNAPFPGSLSNGSLPGGSSMNPDGTVTLQFNDANGFNYQPYGQVTFGTSVTDANACRIQYNRGTGAQNHILSVYGTDFTAPALQGTAPVGSPGVRVAGESCIVDIGHSYVVQESGNSAIVNVMMTFTNTGNIETYIQGFDRQNAPGPLVDPVLNIPAVSFSLPPVDPVMVQQSASPVAFTLNVGATNNFTANVATSVVAPAGISVQMQQTPIPVSGAATSTTVQVMASSSAAVAQGTLQITGTGGGQLQVVNIPVNVMPSGGGPTPTFGLSGPVQESSALQATFTVALTPLNGFPQNDSVNGLVSLSVDPWTSSFVTAAVLQPSSTVPGSFQVTVAMAPGVTAHYGNVYCAIIDATWNSITQQETLCLNALGNTNFSVPASSQAITVPQGGSTTVYASVNNNVAPVVSTSVSCAAGVTTCNASAIVGAASNGVVTMTVNAGSLKAGTTFTQTVTADARSQHLPITVCDPELDCPSGPATVISNDSPVTYNDGSVSSQFSFSCFNCSLNQSVVSCAVPSGNISVGFYGGFGANGTDFSLTFMASPGIATGNYALYCQLAPGGSVLAGYLQVQGAGCHNARVAIQTQPDGSGRKFTFTQVPSTGVFSSGSYSPNAFLSPLTAVASTQGGTFLWTVDNTSMVQFSSTSSGLGPTSSGPSTYILVKEQTDSQVAANRLGRTATVTVTYTGPCGSQSSSFTFVLTEDVTAIAYVDYAKTMSDVNNPNSPSFLNLQDPNLVNDDLYIHLSMPVQCSADLFAWSATGAAGMDIEAIIPGVDSVVNEQERRYANFFITARTANTNPMPTVSNSPPIQIDTSALLSSQRYYRIYNRFEAAYQLSGPGGSILTPIQALHYQTSPGYTLEPCSGQQVTVLNLSPLGELHTGYDAAVAVTADGSLVYQLNEGRVGPLGQAGNTYVNKRPGFGSELAAQYTSYSQTTPYVWSVIQFNRAGQLQPFFAGADSNLPQSTNNNVSVYSTFAIYKDGQRTGTVILQGDVESFISLDYSYRYLGIR